MLTMFFYFPGLMYAINDIGCRMKTKINCEKTRKLRGELNLVFY